MMAVGTYWRNDCDIVDLRDGAPTEARHEVLLQLLVAGLIRHYKDALAFVYAFAC